MSLTKLLSGPRAAKARDCIDECFRIEASFESAGKLKVPHGGKHPTLIGIAFDYAARFELAYRAQHVVDRTWVAETAVRKLRERSRERIRAAAIVGEARGCCTQGWPSEANLRQHEMARHAVRLAQLDCVVRANMPPTFGAEQGVDEALIEHQVVRLMGIAPELWALARRPIVLNPAFPLSWLVGGADADLVAGDTLVEIKVVTSPSIPRATIYQLLGYAVLAWASPSTAGAPTGIGVYSARYARFQNVVITPRCKPKQLLRSVDRLGALWKETVECRRAERDS